MPELGGAGLLGLSIAAVRRQGWLLVPRTLARALARLLAMVPMLALAAEAIHAGHAQGASGYGAAFIAGIPEVLAHPGSWVLLGVGGLLTTFGGWLLATVVRAGVVRQLAAQLGRSDPADDVAFADGAMESATSALLTGVLAEILELVAFVSSVGMVVAGMAYFKERPGPLAAWLMTIATFAIVSVPVIAIGLEVGFVRAVLLCNGPLTALAGGLALARRRASALLPVWCVVVIVQTAMAFGFGLADAGLGAAGHGELAILMLGPRVLVWVGGMVAVSAVELVLLGVFAALVQDDAGRLPPQRAPEPDRVLPAVAVADVLPVAEDFARAYLQADV